MRKKNGARRAIGVAPISDFHRTKDLLFLKKRTISNRKRTDRTLLKKSAAVHFPANRDSLETASGPDVTIKGIQSSETMDDTAVTVHYHFQKWPGGDNVYTAAYDPFTVVGPLQITGWSGEQGLYDGEKFCFSGDAETTETGICTIHATGTTGVPDLDHLLQWSITPIGGSALSYDPPSATGASITCRYEGLPALNSEFGAKTLVLSFPLMQDCSVTEDVFIFYMAEAKNWPGAQKEQLPLPHEPRTASLDYARPNYFYYYSQTDAYVPGVIHCARGSHCDPKWHNLGYPAHVGNIELKGKTIAPYTAPGTDISVVLSSETLYGIDVFAYACRHEWKHHQDYSNWWPSGHVQSEDLDYCYHADREIGDFMKDSVEPTAYPTNYSTETCSTHVYYPGAPDHHDDQLHCLFTQEFFTPMILHPGDFTSYDWAKPGSQWREEAE